MARLKRKDRDTIVQALRAGVVPRRGLQHIQVGRSAEIRELIRDIDRVAEGGASIRFVIGDYGSGKTFFLNLVRLVALEKGLVTMSADLAPDRRLHATGGQARTLYAEMAHNLATRTKPDGGAMASIVERFVSLAIREAERTDRHPEDVIRDRLAHFEDHTGGFDFADVIRQVWRAHDTGDDELRVAALRWLRGEYATKTDARKALGVRTIVDDASVYDHLKLMASFAVAAGYKGLLVSLDEMVNLYKLTSAQARNANYEQILRIFNDVLQGSTEHLGFVMGGTPDFLLNTRRGLHSYEALQSRLAPNGFARDGLVDLSGPVLNLPALTPEEMFVLLRNVRRVMQGEEAALPDAALQAFMAHCNGQIGEAYFRTPRNSVKAFVNFLAVLEQNPGTDWSALIDATVIEGDPGDDLSDIADESAGTPAAPPPGDDLVSFRL